MNLSEKKCVACEGGMPPMSMEDANKLLAELISRWEIVEEKKIKKTFEVKDFLEAIAFVNKIAEIAEQEQHHPDIVISYNKITIELWTHAVGGLSENDFILAAKIDQIKL